MDIPTWLNAIERFVDRRGKPATIACDRAGTFVGGSKMLAQTIRDQLSSQFEDQLTQAIVEKYQIEFHFIPSRMPHFGGAWERMVREAQRAIVKSTATVTNLSFDSLATYLVRAEGIINRRPLAIGEDLGIITPMSILAPASEAAFGFATNCSLSRVIGQLRQCIDHFWCQWTQSYLRSLSAERFPKSSPSYVELKLGDRILFMRTEKFHRLPDSPSLEAGVIRRVFHSSDGIPRRFEVEDSNGKLVEIPLKRIFLPEQSIVNLRGLASGIAPARS
jgi:hypothetical protein